jgi:hypothetical protein
MRLDQVRPYRFRDPATIPRRTPRERMEYRGDDFGKDARQVFLPYCIQQVEDGRYVVLNRNYKPLGFRSRERVDYNDYAVPLRITAKQAAKMSWRGDSGTTMIFFYNDGCIPDSPARLRAYLERYAVFARLKLKPLPCRNR